MSMCETVFWQVSVTMAIIVLVVARGASKWSFLTCTHEITHILLDLLVLFLSYYWTPLPYYWIFIWSSFVLRLRPLAWPLPWPQHCLHSWHYYFLMQLSINHKDYTLVPLEGIKVPRWVVWIDISYFFF